MQQKLCAVCKQPIDELLVVETSLGPVHPGQCYLYILDVPVTESAGELIQETELLM